MSKVGEFSARMGVNDSTGSVAIKLFLITSGGTDGASLTAFDVTDEYVMAAEKFNEKKILTEQMGSVDRQIRELEEKKNKISIKLSSL